jgi:hypothetical protein
MVYIKKNKTWKGYLWKEVVKNDMALVHTYAQQWVNEITHIDNIKKWYKPNQPLPLRVACLEAWIKPVTYYARIWLYPELKEYHNMLLERSKNYSRNLAYWVVEDALSWEIELDDNKKIDVALRFLEKTDQAFNPKTEIETKSLSINFNKTSDDILSDLFELLWKK